MTDSAGRRGEAQPLDDLREILEALAPLRFPIAQGLWMLAPWLGSERIARWVAILEGTPPPAREEEP